LSKTDENIKNILQEKFASHESHVNPEIWNSISNSMASASSTAGAGISIAKILGIAAAAIIAAVTVVYVVTSSEQGQAGSVSITPQNSEVTIDSTTSKDESTQDNSTNATTESGAIVAEKKSVESTAEITQNELIVEDINNGKWNDNTDVPQTLGNDKKQNNEENNSTTTNQKSTSNLSEEPLSASFHTRVVDANTLRYFFFPKTSANASFKWTSSDGYTSSDMTFSHQFNNEGNYSIELTVTDNSGNIASESTTIQVVKPIAFKIPNAFSPGINGKNDIIDFEESTQNESTIVSVSILDRNGNLIYESKNSFIWDGTANNGEMAPNGTYTYIITAIDKLGESRMNKGIIQLFGE
jgi:gliding motility-associated-like protein